jgi:hypothetical protein
MKVIREARPYVCALLLSGSQRALVQCTWSDDAVGPNLVGLGAVGSVATGVVTKYSVHIFVAELGQGAVEPGAQGKLGGDVLRSEERPFV